jgi:hypothetical protein
LVVASLIGTRTKETIEMKRFFLSVLAIALLTANGCDQKSMDSKPVAVNKPSVTMDDVQRDAATSLKTTVAYSQQNKDRIVKNLKEQLATMDTSIEKLRLKGESLANDAKTNWDLKMVELDEKRKSAHAKLTEVEASTAKAWTDVEKGAQSAWEDLETAFQNASKEF